MQVIFLLAFAFLYGYKQNMSMFSRVPVASDFPARLEAVRRLKGITLDELATAIDVATSTVWRWSNGKGGPNQIAIDRMVKAIGQDSVNYLTGKSNKPPALVVKS